MNSAYLDAYAYTGEEKTKDYPISQYLDEFNRITTENLWSPGRSDIIQKVIRSLQKYLNLYPCNYILNARGLFSMAAKEYEQALKDF